MVRIFAFMCLAVALIGCGDKPAATEPAATDTTALDTTAPAPAETNDLLGTWDIALYYDPGQPPSATVLEITDIAEDGALTGSFYQSPFSSARATPFENQVVVSFITSDDSGPYASSGRLSADGGFAGQTLSTGRGFLMPWTAAKRGED